MSTTTERVQYLIGFATVVADLAVSLHTDNTEELSPGLDHVRAKFNQIGAFNEDDSLTEIGNLLASVVNAKLEVFNKKDMRVAGVDRLLDVHRILRGLIADARSQAA